MKRIGGIASNSLAFLLVSVYSDIAGAGQCASPSFQDGNRGVLYVRPHPRALVPADFSGDGILDLAVFRPPSEDLIRPHSGDVLLLAGRGGGGYERLGSLPMQTHPTDIASGDFDRDGDPDLAFVDGRSEEVFLLISRGDGSLEPSRSPSLGFRGYPFSLAAGDFDQNGTSDLVVSHGLNEISLLPGVGDGRFGAPQTLASGLYATDVVASDFDGDGVLDIAAARPNHPNLAVLSGRGDGTFGEAQTYPIDRYAAELAVADLNNDGRPDLAASSIDANGVSILLSEGRNGFRRADNVAAGRYPYGLIFEDFNGDGNVDLVAGNVYDSQGVSLLPGDGHGAFGVGLRIAEGRARPVAVADFDGDARRDLAVADSRGVSIFFQDGNGVLVAPLPMILGEPQLGQPHVLVSSDFDGDGRIDLAAGPSATILSGRGEGRFEKVGPPGLGGPLLILKAADINRDRRTDLIGARGLLSPCSLPTLPPPTPGWNPCGPGLSVVFGSGEGWFVERREVTAVTSLASMAVADFNRDRNPDLVVAEFPGRISALAGDGSGNFGPRVDSPVSGTVAHLLPGYFDGDRELDLAVGGGASVSILRGTGGGRFVEASSTAVSGPVAALASGDFDGDGRSDIAASLTDSVALLLGRGAGRFDTVVEFSLAEGPPVGIVVADFNGDGSPDVAVATYQGSLDGVSAVTVFEAGRAVREGVSLPAVREGVSFPVGQGAAAIVAADVNWDGAPDIVTANVISGDITVLLNACSPPRVVPPRRPRSLRPSPVRSAARACARPDES